MVVDKSNWSSRGETALENELDELKKVSVRRFQALENSLSQPMKTCWSFDAVPKSFAVFGLDFA